MTSIFSSSFSENLRRINASNTQKPEKVTEVKKDFTKVLAGLEQGAEKPAVTKGLAVSEQIVPRNKPAATEVLTNLESKHMESPQAVLSELQRLINQAPAAVSEVVPSVKAPTEAVKNLAPQPLLPTVDGTPPEAPQILSARRVTFAERTHSTPSEIAYKKDDVHDIITTAGKYHGIDPKLGLAVAQAESSFKIDAVSSDGHESKGLFQLLDSTAGDMLGRLDVEEKYNPFDPSLNSHLGVGYLRRLHDLFSVETKISSKLTTHPAKSSSELEKLAVAAFNAGEGNVARAQARALAAGKDPSIYQDIERFLPASTRTYVARVGEMKGKLVENSSSSFTV